MVSLEPHRGSDARVIADNKLRKNYSKIAYKLRTTGILQRICVLRYLEVVFGLMGYIFERNAEMQSNVNVGAISLYQTVKPTCVE